MSIAIAHPARRPSLLVLLLLLGAGLPPLWLASQEMEGYPPADPQPVDSGLAAPAQVTAEAGGGRVRLRWTPVPGASGYLVYEAPRAGAKGHVVATSIDGRAQGLSVDGLAQDRVHFFTVRPIRGHSPGPASAEVHAPALGSPWQELPH